MVQDPKVDIRLGAVYSLSQLRVPAAVTRLLEALDDRDSPLVRATAALALNYHVVKSSESDPGAVAERLVRASNDADLERVLEFARSLAEG